VLKNPTIIYEELLGLNCMEVIVPYYTCAVEFSGICWNW